MADHNEEARPWYEEPEDRRYEEAVQKLTADVIERNLSFEEAAAALDIEDEALKASVLDDALKVLIARMHFMEKKPLEQVAQRLKLPLARLEQAKRQMLKDVEAAAIEQYKSSTGQSGQA